MQPNDRPFQSTLPAWGETWGNNFFSPQKGFQSTLPAWGETSACRSCKNQFPISIHSPCMGRDIQAMFEDALDDDFNPLSLHGERPAAYGHLWPETRHFNPLSLHGERRSLRQLPAKGSSISIHSPRMGRDQGVGACPCARLISIHSPRMGRDPLPFLRVHMATISIHSPRMGRDRWISMQVCLLPDFNPLSPHGERQKAFWKWATRWKFQSTLPAWGETYTQILLHQEHCISIHSPRMGRD